jgi:hypothetical protein
MNFQRFEGGIVRVNPAHFLITISSSLGCPLVVLIAIVVHVAVVAEEGISFNNATTETDNFGTLILLV